MQVHIEKYGELYSVCLIAPYTSLIVGLNLTEKDARVLASDFERCAQAVFAVLPELDQ